MSEEAGSLSKDKIRFCKHKPTGLPCENYSRQFFVYLFDVVINRSNLISCTEKILNRLHIGLDLDHYKKAKDLLAGVIQHDRLHRSGNAGRRHTLIGCHRHPGGVPAHHYPFFSHRKHADYSRHLSKSQPSKHH